MIDLGPYPSSNLKRKTLTLCSCWKIERADGVVLRFTDHDRPLVVNGETFTVTGSVRASAVQKLEGLRVNNTSVLGAISASSITKSDLAAGRYRNAKVTRYLVDFSLPTTFGYFTDVWYVEEVSFDGFSWEASLAGISSRLRFKVGDVYGRTCRWDLGDSNCGVNLAPLTVSGSVGSVIQPRLSFQTSSLSTSSGWYSEGKLVWTSGLNNGISCDVQKHTSSPHKIFLYVETPFAFEAGDTWNIVPGCDKTSLTCRSKFTNITKFGGFPFLPGNNEMLKTPDLK